MKKIILATALAAASSTAMAGPWTVIDSWDYINEAGFFNPATGYADDGQFSDPWKGEPGNNPATAVGGGTSTLLPNYTPSDSTAEVDPEVYDGGTGTWLSATHYVDAKGFNWIKNEDAGVFYNYGSGSSSLLGQSGTTNDGAATILEANTTFSTFDTICWGIDADPSCVTMQDENGNDSSRVTGTATTKKWGQSDFFDGTSITHINNPAGAPSLTSINFADGLRLENSALVDGFFDAPELLLPVVFVETFANAGQIWPEAPRDMFVIDFTQIPPADLAGVSFGPDFADFTVNVVLENSDFTANGEDYHKEYQVTTRLTGLEFFESAGNSQVIGILTDEDSRNTVNAAFSVNAINVSEPGMLGAFGLLAFASSFFARRRNAKK